jgi:hypothetical protein
MSDVKLNDPTLPVDLAPLSLDKPELITATFAKEKVNFVFGLDGKLVVSVFNAEDDVDPAHVFGKKDIADIPFDAASAWLKYAGTSNIKLTSGLNIKSAGFEIDTAAGLQSYVYRKHGASELLAEAQRNDLLSLKTIFSKEQIKTLEINEAVGLEFSGKLSASIKLSWADVWTTGFKGLTELLDSAELVKIKFGPEASISTTVQVGDSFQTQIIKKGANQYLLRIKRNQSKIKTFSFAASITVMIDNPEIITTHLENILEDLLEVNYDKVNKIVSKTVNTLTEEDVILLEAIAARLGWIDTDILTKLKTELADLKVKFNDRIGEAVRTKVTAGFAYDYLRSSENDTIFSATLNEEALDQFHLDILKANTKVLIDHVLINPKSAILKKVVFLSVDIKKQQHSRGFTIGLGNWVAGDKTTASMTVTKRQSEEGMQVNYDGRRSFEDKVGKSKRRWRVDFNAGMSKISNQRLPLANEFDYSLYLNYEWEEKKFNSRDLASFLDFCRVWNIINEGQFHALLGKLDKELKNASALTYACHNTYPSDVFISIINTIATATDAVAHADFYLSLGASLPYWEPFSIRMDPDKRAVHYAAAWKEFLLTESIIPEEIAYQHLKKVDKSLAEKEYDYKPNGLINFNAFAFNAKSNPGIVKNFRAFREGIIELSKAIDPKSLVVHEPVINLAFQKIENLWRHPILIKAFGDYLIRVSNHSSLLLTNAVFTGELRYTIKNKEQVIIIGKS